MISLRRLLASQGRAFVGASTLLIGCGTSPDSTVERFYTAVGKGEIAEAKSYVSAQVVAILGDDKLSAVLSEEAEKIRLCGGIEGVEVSLQGEGEVRSGEATIVYAGECPGKTEKVRLVREDGRWKLGAEK